MPVASVRSTAPSLRPPSNRSNASARTSAIQVSEKNAVVCAISQSRSITPSVGLAFIDLTTSEAVLCQFTDTQTFVRTCNTINVFNPTHLIYPDSATDFKIISIVARDLRLEHRNLSIESASRRYWSETSAYQYVERLTVPEDLPALAVTLDNNFFALYCFSAVGFAETRGRG